MQLKTLFEEIVEDIKSAELVDFKMLKIAILFMKLKHMIKAETYLAINSICNYYRVIATDSK